MVADPVHKSVQGGCCNRSNVACSAGLRNSLISLRGSPQVDPPVVFTTVSFDAPEDNKTVTGSSVLKSCICSQGTVISPKWSDLNVNLSPSFLTAFPVTRSPFFSVIWSANNVCARQKGNSDLDKDRHVLLMTR